MLPWFDRPGVPGKRMFPTGREGLFGDGPPAPGEAGERLSPLPEGVTVLGIWPLGWAARLLDPLRTPPPPIRPGGAPRPPWASSSAATKPHKPAADSSFFAGFSTMSPSLSE